MLDNPTSFCLNRARELTEQADRVLADFHVALRCRCCPEGGSLFGGLGEDEGYARDEGHAGDQGHAPAPRALQRSDFIGLLAAQDLDA